MASDILLDEDDVPMVKRVVSSKAKRKPIAPLAALADKLQEKYPDHPLGKWFSYLASRPDVEITHNQYSSRKPSVAAFSLLTRHDGKLQHQVRIEHGRHQLMLRAPVESAEHAREMMEDQASVADEGWMRDEDRSWQEKAIARRVEDGSIPERLARPKAADINAELKSWDVTDPTKAAIFADRLEEADWYHGVENRHGTNPTLALLRAGVPVHVARHPKSGKVVAWPVEQQRRQRQYSRAAGHHEWVSGPHGSAEIGHPLMPGGQYVVYPSNTAHPTRAAALRAARDHVFTDFPRYAEQHMVIGKGGAFRVYNRPDKSFARVDELDPHDFSGMTIPKIHPTLDAALSHAARLAHPVAEEGEHGVYARTDGKYTLVRHRPAIHGNVTVSDNHETPEAALAAIPHRMARLQPKDKDADALIRPYARLRPGKSRGIGGLHRLADMMHEKFPDHPATKWLPHILTHPDLRIYHSHFGPMQKLTLNHLITNSNNGTGWRLKHEATIEFGRHRWSFHAPVESMADVHEFVKDAGWGENLIDAGREQGLPDTPPVKLSRDPHDWTHLGPYNDWVQENGGYHDVESQNAVNAHIWDGAPRPHIAVHPDSGKPVAWVDDTPFHVDTLSRLHQIRGQVYNNPVYHVAHGPGGVHVLASGVGINSHPIYHVYRAETRVGAGRGLPHPNHETRASAVYPRTDAGLVDAIAAVHRRAYTRSPVRMSRDPKDWEHLGPYNDWVQENGGYHDEHSQNLVNAHIWDGAPTPHIAVHPDSGKPVAWHDAHTAHRRGWAARWPEIRYSVHGPGGVGYVHPEGAYEGRFFSGVFYDDNIGPLPSRRNLSLEDAIEHARQLAFPKNLPHRMARVQAPAGGAVVNNTYSAGGSFLAEPLKRIRTIAPLLKRLKVSS